MSAPRWNDAEERQALIAGAGALRLRAERLGTGPGAAEAVAEYRRAADVLEEMANCYAVKA